MNKTKKKFIKLAISTIMFILIGINCKLNVFAQNGYTENLIPIMTSNSAPKGKVTVSSIYDENFPGYQAVDGDKTVKEKVKTAWVAGNSTNNWFCYEFDQPVIISKYSISGHDTAPVQSPKSWIFQGSKDGKQWINLHEISDEGKWDINQYKEFEINNNNSYKFYRLYNINSNFNWGVYVGISDLKMMAKNIPSISIVIDKTSLNLLEGNSEKITATVLPENATNKKVIWSSSDESIAKVDENGNVTAIKEGQAIITAKLENTDLAAICEVNVSKLVEENKNNAILSISLVNGATKEYDVSMEEVNKFINWYEERANGKGSALYSFDKKLNPYKSVTEYIAHDKIASFEVREYEISK